MKKRKNNLKIKTQHGDLNGPLFLPDATRGFIKTCDFSELIAVGVKALVVNTFHLYLQPGRSIIKKAGGLHRFMNWSRPLLSDSGGFQIFSLIHNNPRLGKVDDSGAQFRSPLDGRQHQISPEKSIQIQFDLGTDLMVCLDDCPPYNFSRKKIEVSVERTINWAKRSHQEYIRQIKKRKINRDLAPKLIAVIQGGLDRDLRKKCLDSFLEISDSKFLGEKMPIAGYGFGARPVDEEGRFLLDILDYTAKIIPDDKIKMALGIGSPADIYRCYQMGWNLFDCVIPSREGRHGKLYQFKKEEELGGPGTLKKANFYREINLKKSLYANDFRKIKENSKIKELREGIYAYLHHLFKVKEALAGKWASLNNLEFYNKMMRNL